MEDSGKVNFQVVKKEKHVILVNIKTNPQNWDKSNKSRNQAINFKSQVKIRDVYFIQRPRANSYWIMMIENYFTKIPGENDTQSMNVYLLW